MRGKRTIFSLLLLPLWLAVVACGVSAAPAVSTTSDQISRSREGESSRNDSDKNFPLHKNAFHHLARRAAPFLGASDDRLQPGGDEIITVSNRSQTSESLFSVVEAPAALRHGWQFHLRMAPEPRAPSFVS